MTGKVENRLKEQGIALPEPVAPVANYVPFRISGNQLVISGQVPIEDGKPKYLGVLGTDGMDLETGQAAARLCAVNILSQAKGALGDLDRITACIRLGVFVAATPDFTQHPQVANAASDLMVEAFGEAGRHARAAVGMASLPLGVPVEVEALFEIA